MQMMKLVAGNSLQLQLRHSKSADALDLFPSYSIETLRINIITNINDQ